MGLNPFSFQLKKKKCVPCRAITFFEPKALKWVIEKLEQYISIQLYWYGYCLNNPLMYTDPSGYTWGIFKPFVQAASWASKNVGTVLTAAYLGATAVACVLVPPLGGAMLGAYVGGLTANGGQLNMGRWNYQSSETWLSVGFGAAFGALGGYGLAHPGSVAVKCRWLVPGVGALGFNFDEDISFQWSTNAGGGGGITISEGGFPFDGAKRMELWHHVRTNGSLHSGLDYGGYGGENVKSLSTGEIGLFASSLKQATRNDGIYVQVIGNDGRLTMYCHLQDGSTSGLYQGMPVDMGTIIGRVGNTGHCEPSTYYHLHIQVWDVMNFKNQYNPLTIYPFMNP